MMFICCSNYLFRLPCLIGEPKCLLNNPCSSYFHCSFHSSPLQLSFRILSHLSVCLTMRENQFMSAGKQNEIIRCGRTLIFNYVSQRSSSRMDCHSSIYYKIYVLYVGMYFPHINCRYVCITPSDTNARITIYEYKEYAAGKVHVQRTSHTLFMIMHHRCIPFGHPATIFLMCQSRVLPGLHCQFLCALLRTCNSNGLHFGTRVLVFN